MLIKKVKSWLGILKLEKKLEGSFSKIKKEILALKESQINKKEFKEEILIEVRQILREANTQKATRSDLKAIEKKALRILDVAQLKRAISKYIEEGYKTCQIRDEVISRFNIKTTCFFKYLKLVREEHRVLTTPKATRSKEE